MNFIVGIDPGLGGAIAFLDTNQWTLEVVSAPTFQITVNGKSRNVLDVVGLAEILSDKSIDHVFVEKVHAMPKQGVSSTFKFGECFGMIEGIIAALKYRVTYVTPNRWKKVMEVHGDKSESIIRATELAPTCKSVFWPLLKDDGMADATLIAMYGAKELGLHVGQIKPDHVLFGPVKLKRPVAKKKRAKLSVTAD